MDQRINLYDLTKEFIYSPELEALNVFSKEYLNFIIKPYHSCNGDNDNYASICIDFNKFNSINKKYGRDRGDKIIHDSLSLMRSILPSDCVIARMGGDEFIFIIQNCSPEKIDHYIDNIQDVIAAHKEELLNCSLTAYGVHCSEKISLSEMINEADLKITEQKNTLNESSSQSKWAMLEKKLKKNLKCFFDSLRLYSEPITIPMLKGLFTQSISSCKDLLESDFTKANYDNNDCCLESDFDIEKIKYLHSIFSKENLSDEDINNIDEQTIFLLLNHLIRDPITNSFSKSYFKKYLLEDCNQEFEVKYISTSFIKLSNTVFSHSITDNKIQNLITDFIDYLDKDHTLIFCNDSFLDSRQNYFISLGAGDYLIALPKNNKYLLNNDDINNYLNSTQKHHSNLEDISQLFVSKDFHSVNLENFDAVVETLSKECKKYKDIYKLSMFESPATRQALNSIIFDSVEYYKNNIPFSDTINNKSRFLNLLGNTMLNISYSLNSNNTELQKPCDLNKDSKTNKNEEER